MAKHCKSEEDRELVSFMILKMIPKLETLDISEIQGMLDFMEEGFIRYEWRNQDSRHVTFKPILSEYVELKFKQANVTQLINQLA